ncbi:MAG: ComEC/Rec2 family competence protein [Elusimicrobiota bacterium]|jgi:ComEC/Rec2-related protein|nr:ComEC/Rec2 family competence protein [Elusimicrobiota bacterium]
MSIKLARKILTYILIFYIAGIFVINFLGVWDKPNKKNKLPSQFLNIRTEIYGEILYPPTIYEKFYQKRIKFFIKLDKIGDYSAKNKNTKIIVDCNLVSSYIPILGQKIKLYGEILPIELPNKYNNYLKYQNVYYKIFEQSLDNYQYVGNGNFFRSNFGKIRRFVLERILMLYDGLSAEVLPALIVGDKNYLTDETKDFIAEAGISHIIAISGMHVALVFAFLCLFFRNKKTVLFLLVTLSTIWFYAGITGLSPSCIRACGMLSIIMFAGLFDKYAFTVSNLMLTCAIMLIMNPRQLFMLSFLFSFLGVFSIIYFNNFWKNFFKQVFFIINKFLFFGFFYKEQLIIKNKIQKKTKKSFKDFKKNKKELLLSTILYILNIFKEIFFASISAQTLLSPFIIFYFGNFNISSVIFNLTLIPFLAIIMNISFISIFFSLFSFSVFIKIAKMIAFINKIIVNTVFSITEFLFERISVFIEVKMVPYYLTLILCILLFLPILRDIKENKKNFQLFLIWNILFLFSFILLI